MIRPICKQLVKVKICTVDSVMAVWRKLLPSIWKSVSSLISIMLFEYEISRRYKEFKTPKKISATKMWQHERNDWDQATCTDFTCSFANNCAPNAQFGCGHFTQNVWKSTTHVCYQVGFRKRSFSRKFHDEPWLFMSLENHNKFYESKKYSKGLDNREYIVARYSPPGNVGTRYHTNLEANACAATNSCMSTDYSQIGNNCNGK